MTLVFMRMQMQLCKANSMPLRMWVSGDSVLSEKIELDLAEYEVPDSTSILGLHKKV